MSSITRREAIGACAGGALSPAAPPKKPNILLILSDDQGYGDLSLHGNPYLKTPNLDGLAREGVEFTRFYVSPVCAPTRASLLTGRYWLRGGVHGVTHGRETMRAEEVTLAEALRSAGYRTALYGKWHLGEHYPYAPHAQGFEDYIGFRTGHWMTYFDTTLERKGKPYPTKGYITDVLTNEAIRFFERNRANPFFLYLAYNVPHSPFQVPERYYQRFQGRGLPPETAAVYAMVSNLDENIGRLLGELRKLGLAESTIVIFLTDNGPNGQRFNSGLRGVKGSVYEGGNRVPFFVRWPGVLPPGRKVDTIAAHIDVYPTLLDMCGVKLPEGPPLDGKSIFPLMQADQPHWPDRALFVHRENLKDPSDFWAGTVRTQRFNLVQGKELYEIPTDPGEKQNVADKYPEKVKELRAAYEAWYRVAADQCGFLRRPIPVGYKEENPVILPAPQSYLHGELRFHGGPGYAHDWITEWTRLEDYVHWEIDVVRGGRYEVTVKYLCARENLGAKIVLAAGESRLEATITQPTPMERKPNPSVIPGDNGYPEMYWGTLSFGTMTLPRGSHTLSVKALTKPGAVVMDLKEVSLRAVGGI